MKKIALVFSFWITTLQVFLPAPAHAEKRLYVLDRAHCQLNFIGEALFVSAHGYFEKWDADLQIDRDNLENSSVALTIETASLNTRVERRDNHLRSADFFDAANHPQIKFVSTKVSRVDDKNFNLTGDLTIRGITKPVQVPVKLVFLREGDARFKGEFQVNRRDFGMNYNSRMNPVEDLVTIQFDMHLVDKAVMEAQQQQRQQQRLPDAPRPPR